MNASQFFSQPQIQLPLVRASDDFLVDANAYLAAYQQVLDRVDATDPLSVLVIRRREDAKLLCERLIHALSHYFNGLPHRAFDFLDASLSIMSECVDRMKTTFVVDEDTKYFYRVRKQIAPTLSKNDLFHIPFEKRHLVATQRYSIPGMPCLYMGGSMYLCWVEMGQPAMHKLQASAFWIPPTQSVQVIDFSERPSTISTSLLGLPVSRRAEPDIRRLEAYISLWPLLALSSVRVRFRDSPFKPEYVLPQLFLQWVTQQPNVDGIRYFSTHLDTQIHNPHWFCNYVFPSRVRAPLGRCIRLCSKFRMTDPCNWQLLRGVPATYRHIADADYFEVNILPGEAQDYSSTEFGLVQNRLNHLARIARQTAESDSGPQPGEVLPGDTAPTYQNQVDGD